MEITEAKLKLLWDKREEIFNAPQNEYIIERFTQLNDLFNDIQNLKFSETNGCFFLNDSKIILKNQNGDLISNEILSNYLVAPKAELCQDRNTGKEGLHTMTERFQLESNNQEYLKKLILDIGCMLGGFSFVNDTTNNNKLKMVSSFRIKSNIQNDKHDNGSLCTGLPMWPSSHFADTNVFYRIIETIKNMRDNTFTPDTSNVVLHYTQDEAKQEVFREILKYRFPYKFFYSWTHKETIIPIFSLQVYQKLCSLNNLDIKYDDKNINQEYSEFTNKWKNYSTKIATLLVEKEKQNEQFWLDLGKLFAIIMIQDQDIKNIRDLIETGNKAIILWGPPGTGKTYQAKELVKNMLKIDNGSKFENYRYTPGSTIQNTGAYALVQFHPNYTYEDFVGGISPKLDGDKLSYTLKTGAFKSFCDEANKDNNKDKKFIFIIDEINRANLSAVFGELLYALEYRDEPITIPNFKEPFVIPNNVYIIGTMNNVDKSLDTFDLALRRRFGFFKSTPKLKVIADMLAQYEIDEESLSNYIIKCEELNNAIGNSNGPLGLTEEHKIGQAYFGKIKDFLSQETQNKITSLELEKLWIYHLQPLLEEYLGGRLEDTNIEKYINELKDHFLANK